MNIFFTIIGVCFLLPHVSIAENKNSYLVEGLNYFNEKRYEEAIQLFQTGYGIEPKPDFLFALGQAERLSGDCQSAIIYYQKFLDSEAIQTAKEAAKEQLNKCQAALESNAALEGIPIRVPNTQLPKKKASAPKSTVEPSLQAVQQNTIQYRNKPWYKDWTGNVLLGAGVTAGAGSLMLFNRSHQQLDDANNANNYRSYESSVKNAKFTRHLSYGAAAIGAVFITGAIWRYKTADQKIVENISHMSFSLGRDMAIVSYGNDF